jgi:predicted acetyltransferase
VSELPLRVGTAEDWPAVNRLLMQVFHHAPDPDVERIEGSVVEPERTLLAEDGGAVVAHAAAYTRDLTVPGAVLPAAHVTLVGVAPTHRRRRLLSRMMERQLREVADAGREPVAVLWASEGAIYPRFGYGQAAQKLEFAIENREVRLTAAPVGALRAVDPAASWKTFAEVYERQRPDRPGWSSRDERWWRFVLADPQSRRAGATGWRAVVLDGPDGPSGYALWRTRGGWAPTGPQGEVLVREVVAADAGGYATLWRLLLDVDLTRTVRHDFAAVDDPLLHLVDHPRRLGARLTESLWVRLVDLPAALATRRYAAPVDVVLDVTDPLLPGNTGRWRLTGGPDGAACTRTADEPDLACTVLELGAAYLGGVSLDALARAGRVVQRTPGALARASVAFGWHRLPAATEVF